MKLFEAGSLWSYKGYRLFWYNTTIFVLGASAFPIALAVTVLDAGGTATSLGLILGARVLAAVVFSPFAGVWSDRLPRKQVMIVADLFRAVLVFGMVFISAPKLPHILLALAVFFLIEIRNEIVSLISFMIESGSPLCKRFSNNFIVFVLFLILKSGSLL